MATRIDGNTWVYVLVQNPGADEKIIGQNDPDHGISFIPAFTDKDSAQQGFLQFPKARGHKYEIQAIIYEDLERYAADAQSLIFFLDAEGKIIDKKAPAGQTRSIQA